jgi:hypothetical protein
MGAKYGKHRASGSEKSGSSVFRPRFFSKDKEGSDKSLSRSGSKENLAAAASKEEGRDSPTSSDKSSQSALISSNSAALRSGGSAAAPDSSSSRVMQGTTPASPKRGPSFSGKNEKQAALFQKSLSQEGLVNFIRNESVARAMQESGIPALEDDEFTENPFVLRNSNVLLNTWEIHVSNDEKPPLVSSFKVQLRQPACSSCTSQAAVICMYGSSEQH